MWSCASHGADEKSRCDGEKKQLLFSDSQCTKPIESRYGDDKNEFTDGELNNPYRVYACNEVVKVTIGEKKRKSRIQQDFEAVIDSIKPGTKAQGAAEPTCTLWEQQLQFQRGTLEVKGLGEDGETLQAKPVISGLAEHWFLGLDLPVTDQKTLKYDSATGTLQPREKDVQLYLSLNYLFGDVLADVDEGEASKGLGSFSFKIFMRASSKPLDSAGVGLGYRLPKISMNKLNLDVSGVNLFVGHFWTKEDAIEGGVAKPDSERDAQWRVGVTFDVGSMIKAVKW